MEALKVTIPRDYTDIVQTRHKTIASYSEKFLSYSSSNTETIHAATLVATGAQFIDYANGGSVPLEADRFTVIKEKLSSIRTDGISGRAALEVIMQSITIFQAYASLYEAIKDIPIKDYLPFNEVLFPLASLYSKQKELFENIEAWQEARGTDSESEEGIKLAGSLASCLLYVAQIFVFLAATKITVSAQAVLSAVIYASTFFQFFQSEFNAEVSQQVKDHTPPRIILRA